MSTLNVNTIANSNGTSAITTNSDGTIAFSVDKREKIITGAAQTMSGTEKTLTGIPSNAHCVRLYICLLYTSPSPRD